MIPHTRDYSPELTVEHNGFVNGTTALAYLTENSPDADQVVVVGVSAGSESLRSGKPGSFHGQAEALLLGLVQMPCSQP